MKAPQVTLGDVAESVDYGLTASATTAPVGPKFLRITDIQDDTVDWDSVPYCQADSSERSRNRLEDGDIVFARTGATTGKSFLVRSPPENAVFASYLIRVRPSDVLDSSYVAHFFKSPTYWAQILKVARGAAQPGVNASVLKQLMLPLPAHGEQRRIAAILDKADAIRRKREEALALADELLKSVFLEMFGDPVTNPKKLEQKPLGTVARFISGATPNKSINAYWDGAFPWVSPKDMKVETIHDAEDHVSERAFADTNLKRIPASTPIIVVRGMILAHTVPMAMTAREVAINQDMKAIVFDERVAPGFGFWCLRVQHAELLSRIETAAHGTKRLDSERLGSLPIHLPTAVEQGRFVAIANRYSKHRAALVVAQQSGAALFASLSQRAFRGEL